MRGNRIAGVRLAMVVTSGLVLAAGCMNSGGGASAGHADKVVKIGVLIDLSGPAATPGIGIKHSMQLAQQIINDKHADIDLPLAKDAGLSGLHGAKVQFVFADSRSDPQTGANLAEKLITSDHVVGLIGDYSTDTTAAESQAAERLGVPFIAAESTGNALTQRGYHSFFRTSPDQTQIAKNTLAFFQYEKKANSPVKIGSFFSTAEVYRAQVLLTQQLAGKYGLKDSLVSNVSYQANSPTLDSEVARLMSKKPNVLYVGAYTPDAILLMKTLNRQGIKPAAIVGEDAGFNDPAFIKAIGTHAGGVISRDVWAPDIGKAKPIAATINNMYKKAYGPDMTGDDTRAFTAGDILADAVNRAGSTDSKAVRNALAKTNLPASATIMPWGPVRFDAKGQNSGAGSILVQYTASGSRYTVWPLSDASHKPVWPMPAA